jgi:hypothetical protein
MSVVGSDADSARQRLVRLASRAIGPPARFAGGVLGLFDATYGVAMLQAIARRAEGRASA